MELYIVIAIAWCVIGNLIAHRWAMSIGDYTLYDMFMCFIGGCVFGPIAWVMTYGQSFKIKRKKT